MSDDKVPCEVYSRIVGYLRPVQNWNAAKQQEFADRQVFRVAGKVCLRCRTKVGEDGRCPNCFENAGEMPGKAEAEEECNGRLADE